MELSYLGRKPIIHINAMICYNTHTVSVSIIRLLVSISMGYLGTDV